MADDFLHNSPGLDSPADDAAAVTPHDTNDLDHVSRALWIGTAGNVSVVTKNGSTVTFPNASGWMPIRASRVRATGTTATDIVAVW